MKNISFFICLCLVATHNLTLQISSFILYLIWKANQKNNIKISYMLIYIIGAIVALISLILNFNKYNFFIIFYIINIHLAFTAWEGMKKINDNKNIIIILALTTLFNIFDVAPKELRSPVFDDLESEYFYRAIGLWGNPNLSAYIVGIMAVYLLGQSNKIKDKYIITAAIATSAIMNLSRTMIIAIIVTLASFNRSKIFKYISAIMVILSFLYIIMPENQTIFIRLFVDFDSLLERIYLFNQKIGTTDYEYFDSDINALAFSLGYISLPLHIITLLFAVFKKNNLLVFISISGIAGYGLCSAYTTPILISLIINNEKFLSYKN